ncbi:LOW QUALITY PROTEIN: C5a peptidase [Frankliniella fusca]|uniref:C5a peptidase n=1 Tax=Frankliniella fusca TaxID=407009 RepID=A0AAE1I266_9NEOP|nr:LOW QUALITY PROTEIN: C5a peptidase [Frankliniella fusca]
MDNFICVTKEVFDIYNIFISICSVVSFLKSEFNQFTFFLIKQNYTMNIDITMIDILQKHSCCIRKCFFCFLNCIFSGMKKKNIVPPFHFFEDILALKKLYEVSWKKYWKVPSPCLLQVKLVPTITKDLKKLAPFEIFVNLEGFVHLQKVLTSNAQLTLLLTLLKSSQITSDKLFLCALEESHFVACKI